MYIYRIFHLFNKAGLSGLGCMLDACLTGDQEVAGSTPAGSATVFHVV